MTEHIQGSDYEKDVGVSKDISTYTRDVINISHLWGGFEKCVFIEHSTLFSASSNLQNVMFGDEPKVYKVRCDEK